MANVYLCREGPHPLVPGAGPAYVIPVERCVRELWLSHWGFLKGVSAVPRFNADSKLGEIGGLRHVVVQVGEGEADGWKAGFYTLRMTPRELRERLG